MAVLKTAEVRKKFIDQAATPIGNSPQEAAKFIASEIQAWADVIKKADVKLAN